MPHPGSVSGSSRAFRSPCERSRELPCLPWPAYGFVFAGAPCVLSLKFLCARSTAPIASSSLPQLSGVWLAPIRVCCIAIVMLSLVIASRAAPIRVCCIAIVMLSLVIASRAPCCRVPVSVCHAAPSLLGRRACIPKKSQESGEDEASSAIFPKRSTNCLNRKIATDLMDSCQLWKR
jgi:hypothetical protein